MSGYPWQPGDKLLAADLNAAIANAAFNSGAVPLVGGTMTGPLILSGAPTDPLGAATCGYVDTRPPLGGPYLATAGGTMAGALTLSADPSGPLMAATRQYVDLRVTRSGDTMGGPLFLSGDPSSPLMAATQQYVDGVVTRAGGPFLPLVGGVVSGPASIGGPLVAGAMFSVRNGGLYQTGAPQPDHSVDIQYSSYTNNVVYSADASAGANLGLVSTLQVDAGGFRYSATHSAAVYGTLGSVGAGTVDFISGVSGAAGNAGTGTVTNVAAFRAHNTYNTGGGTIANDWAFWHDAAPVGTATKQYGFYIARPSGMGITAPVFNLDIQAYSAGMNATQGIRVVFVNGQSNFTVTSTGLGLGASAATAQLDIRGIDNLSTTRLLRLRNTTTDIVDVRSDGSIGFNAATPITKPTVSGAWAGSTAGKALCVALAAYGLITDSTTA